MQVADAIWMSPQDVADFLGVTLKTVWAYEEAQLLHGVAPLGRGPGKRVYFHRDDVEAFARTGLPQKARKSMDSK